MVISRKIDLFAQCSSFKTAFSRECSLLTEISPVSGNFAVMNSAKEASKQGFLKGMSAMKSFLYLFTDWYKCLGIEKLLEEARRMKTLPEAHRLSLKRKAKELTVFLTQLTIVSGRKYRPGNLVFALELVIRAAPRFKFYYGLLRKTLPTMRTEEQGELSVILLEVFDVNESKFFQVVTKDDDFDFFEAWYQKLVECNFLGVEAELHLAQLTTSLLATVLINEDEEFFCLLKKCLERVCIPMMMAVESDQQRYPLVISSTPRQMKVELLNRLLTDEVITSVTSQKIIIYALIFKSLYLEGAGDHRAERYKKLSAASVLKLKSIFKGIQFVLAHIIPDLEYFSEALETSRGS